jgi:hypothetical protein
MCGNTLLYFTYLLVDKAKQYMLTAYTLTYMTNAWVLRLHPGIDDSL